jgi:hypothetical protein
MLSIVLAPRGMLTNASGRMVAPALHCWGISWRKPMDDPNNTTRTLDKVDEDILTYTVSDEALEAAAGTERAANTDFSIPPGWPNSGCCSG